MELIFEGEWDSVQWSNQSVMGMEIVIQLLGSDESEIKADFQQVSCLAQSFNLAKIRKQGVAFAESAVEMSVPEKAPILLIGNLK